MTDALSTVFVPSCVKTYFENSFLTVAELNGLKLKIEISQKCSQRNLLIFLLDEKIEFWRHKVNGLAQGVSMGISETQKFPHAKTVTITSRFKDICLCSTYMAAISRRVPHLPIDFETGVETHQLHFNMNYSIFRTVKETLSFAIMEAITKNSSLNVSVVVGDERLPTIFESSTFKFVYKYFTFVSRKMFLRLIQRKRTWNSFIHINKETQLINMDKNTFAADPFIWTSNGKNSAFIEYYESSKLKGSIAAIPLDENFQQGDSPIVILEEDFHLSFPFLFSNEDKLFMVPESSESCSTSIYICDDFPLVWRKINSLLEGVPIVDSIIVSQGKFWYLIANDGYRGINVFDTKLNVWRADSPTSDNWELITKTPISYPGSGTRNGGLIKLQNGDLYRVGQIQDFSVYGAGHKIFKMFLSENCYEEQEDNSFNLSFIRQDSNVHHVTFDGMKGTYDWWA